MNSKIFLQFAWVLCITGSAYAADDGAYLDPPYRDRKYVGLIDDRAISDFELPVKNDVLSVIANQTVVKSQASRGTCSIFSATAMLESMMVIKRGMPITLDLSEEWLEYLIMRIQGSEGSSTSNNFNMFLDYGSPEEVLFPYIGETWNSLSYSGISQKRCEKAEPQYLQHCLLGHRDRRLMDQSDEVLLNQASEFFDEEFQKARADAAHLRDTQIQSTGSSLYVSRTSDLKKLLADGIPVILDIDFYYGAWNHSLADQYGIGRNMDHWAKGIVGNPEPGSIDMTQSHEHRAGHSVVIVGYDDTMEVTTQVKMEDGSTKEFKYTGVYFFKNSWGTWNFGTETPIAGQIVSGYGIMTQKYADDFGSFYKLPIKKAE